MPDPYAPVPVIVPVEVRKVVQRIVGWHKVCRGCGITFASQRRDRLTCGVRCRQRLWRLTQRHLQRAKDEAEDARIAAAEQRLAALRRQGRRL